MSDRVAKVGIDDIMEHAAAGVLRGLQAKDLSVERLVASGFMVRLDLTAGGRLLDLIALNPQPVPPVSRGGGGAISE